MLALSVEPAQIVIGILVGLVAFFLAWFLLGTAAFCSHIRPWFEHLAGRITTVGT